jgi:hypothetical protein
MCILCFAGDNLEKFICIVVCQLAYGAITCKPNESLAYGVHMSISNGRNVADQDWDV